MRTLGPLPVSACRASSVSDPSTMAWPSFVRSSFGNLHALELVVARDRTPRRRIAERVQRPALELFEDLALDVGGDRAAGEPGLALPGLDRIDGRFVFGERRAGARGQRSRAASRERFEKVAL